MPKPKRENFKMRVIYAYAELVIFLRDARLERVSGPPVVLKFGNHTDKIRNRVELTDLSPTAPAPAAYGLWPLARPSPMNAHSSEQSSPLTHRWRKADSNHRFRFGRRSRDRLAVVLDEGGAASKPC
jgi:hypothetical protein